MPSPTDPIFAAIKAHQDAYRRWMDRLFGPTMGVELPLELS
jgi:hypothetical protein